MPNFDPRELLEAGPDAILVVDDTGAVVFANALAHTLFGYDAGELVGQPVDVLVPDVRRATHREKREQYLQSPRIRTMGVGQELSGRRRDGTELPVDIGLSPLTTADGEFVVCAVRDTTERRRVQERLRTAEERLLQAQKMEAVGNLAGGVAHDFNNIISVILSYCEILSAQTTNASMLTGLGVIRESCLRAIELTRQLLAFGRRQMLEPRLVALDEIVRGVEPMLATAAGARCRLRVELAAGLPPVRVDATQIERVLMNLVINARDAMPEGGEVTVETGDGTAEAAAAGMAPGPYVYLAVRDQGHGVDPAIQQRIFEPFFTTKSRGKGTGLGLSTVFGIVQQSGGLLTLTSEAGAGSVFRALLPAAQPDEVTAATTGAKAAENAKTILVVDDEEWIRVALRTLLEQQGYRVLAAHDTQSALETERDFAGTIDLLLTDVQMPGRSGVELAHELRARRPVVRVLLMSGHPDAATLATARPGSEVEFLPKPFEGRALLRKVREVLGQG